VAREQRRLQFALGRLSHRSQAERLKLSTTVDGAPDRVVFLDRLLRVLELHELLVVTELLVHGLLDAPDELARPELSAPMPNC